MEEEGVVFFGSRVWIDIVLSNARDHYKNHPIKTILVYTTQNQHNTILILYMVGNMELIAQLVPAYY